MPPKVRLARERRRPAGFIKPCQPTLSDKPPSGPQWLHEIKHDGYRIIARKSGDTVRPMEPQWAGLEPPLQPAKSIQRHRNGVARRVESRLPR